MPPTPLEGTRTSYPPQGGGGLETRATGTVDLRIDFTELRWESDSTCCPQRRRGRSYMEV
ncbi:hypothetical protein RHCRD62_30751 [Rhodococcus sp. RD6.2]|nr:hypothetical protein RHCRD62_30751 [Rhodococcus sp. RD6.2]